MLPIYFWLLCWSGCMLCCVAFICLRLHCFCLLILEVVFHSQEYLGQLSFEKKLALSSIYTKEVIFHFPKNWGRLPFSKNRCRLQFQKIEVVFHISSILVWVAWKCLNSFCGLWWANQVLCHSQLELMLSWAVTI